MSPDEAKKIIRANYPPANYRMLREALGLVMSAAEHPELFGTREHFPDATKKIDAAPALLEILSEIQPGDAKRFDRFFRECMCPDGEAPPECCMCSEGTNEFCDMLRRYQAMAAKMGARP